MKNRLLFLLLLSSGSLLVPGTGSGYTVRRFKYVTLKKTWAEAQTYCRETFLDLATIQNSNNITEAQKVAGTSQVWIGLFNGTWKWSQEQNQDISSSSWYTNWYPGQPQEENCVAFSNNGYWSTMDCGLQYPFFCFNALLQTNILVNMQKTWSEAQTYCRTQYSDLSSITNALDNTALYLKVILGPTYAWTGLHRSSWTWSDGSNGSFTAWGFQPSYQRGDCVLMDLYYGTWFWKPCSEGHPFLCYADYRPLSKRSVKVHVNPGSADLSDPEVQDSLLQQLKLQVEEQEVGGVTEEVKLSWQTLPDGRIFYREEETAPPAG
ncbi:macrophage mannose receptor 1 [Austrofundulus limnaeus]|uniref:Macrophage mannose receptor 1 n=1 Tax=Austrofundulus limnaeus TaxID=52670 RepID=A0A2I4CYA1_AUSLI|nr:PREDICTED: macrophage mannose receptor 1-like [Austrofundulus limnaeus]